MAVGLQRKVRRALLTLLKNDAGVLALVAKEQIHPLNEPVWPFIKLHAPVTRRLRASGVNGGVVTWDIHAFARSKADTTAEDHAGLIGEAIEACLADNRIAITGSGTARIELSDIRLLEDDTPDSFHWFAQVNCRVLAA